MKKKIISMLLMAGAIMAVPTGAFAAETETSVSGVEIECSMSSFGYEAERIVINVDSTADLQGLTEADFSLSGCVTNGVSSQKRDVAVNQVLYTDSAVILETDSFLVEKSEDSLTLDCTNDALDFTYEAVTNVTCAEHDAFSDETMTVGDTTVQYKLFSPQTKDEELLPLVIYNHGGGNTGYEGVLTDDSFACAWAEEENQKSIPCYVMAPFRASVKDETVNKEEEMQAIKAAIDQLVADGKVDPNRIYMTGESMGSIYTVSFANAYPGYLAAIAVMNGGPFGIEEGTSLEDAVAMDLDSPWSDEELQTLADSQTAVMFIQALGDNVSIPIRYATVYTKLMNMGMTPDADLVWNSYTAEQFNSLLKGNTKIPVRNNTAVATDPIIGTETYTNGNFHNSSRAAGWDTRVRTWLMIQELNKEPLVTASN